MPLPLPQLEANVSDDEDLARFLTSSGHYNASGAKANAFLPHQASRETSVFRHGAEPREGLWQLGAGTENEERRLHGAAFVVAGAVRTAGLVVEPDPLPSLHAAIRGWPWDEADPEKLKARHKEIALKLAIKSRLILR